MEAKEKYTIVNNQKKLQHKKQMVFIKNGRIKYFKTVDAGAIFCKRQKTLWFDVALYPGNETY
jgi:hypothetical protein